MARSTGPEVTIAPCANSFAFEPDPAANDVERKLANRMGANSPRRRGSPGSGTTNSFPPDYIRAVPTVDLPDDELAAVTAAIRGVIEGDRYPHAPRLDPLRAALARLDAATAPKPTPHPKGRRQPKPTSGRGDNRTRSPSLVNFAIELSEQLPQAPADGRNEPDKQDDVAGRHHCAVHFPARIHVGERRSSHANQSRGKSQPRSRKRGKASRSVIHVTA